ncbi:MAG: hypothetical protein ACPG7F_07420 [Aggregatilineales bacterium]
MNLSLHEQHRVNYKIYQTDSDTQDEKPLADDKDSTNEPGKNYGGIVISI